MPSQSRRVMTAGVWNTLPTATLPSGCPAEKRVRRTTLIITSIMAEPRSKRSALNACGFISAKAALTMA